MMNIAHTGAGLTAAEERDRSVSECTSFDSVDVSDAILYAIELLENRRCNASCEG